MSCLQQVRDDQQQRIAAETSEERESRLQQVRDNRRHCSSASEMLPLFLKPHVHSKMSKFHYKLAALQVPSCTTCLEKFPGMDVNGQSECFRCSRDKHLPKLYSSHNNMNPGPVPPELMVSIV